MTYVIFGCDVKGNLSDLLSASGRNFANHKRVTGRFSTSSSRARVSSRSSLSAGRVSRANPGVVDWLNEPARTTPVLGRRRDATCFLMTQSFIESDNVQVFAVAPEEKVDEPALSATANDLFETMRQVPSPKLGTPAAHCRPDYCKLNCLGKEMAEGPIS